MIYVWLYPPMILSSGWPSKPNGSNLTHGLFLNSLWAKNCLTFLKSCEKKTNEQHEEEYGGVGGGEDDDEERERNHMSSTKPKII